MENNQRRRSSAQDPYPFKISGSFGIFSSEHSIPIEFILTTFNHNQLEYLTLARDVQTELNFELMVQRDIDEDRAIGEIAPYLRQKEDGSKHIAFLPPILAAVIGVDDNLNIEEYYPEFSYTPSKDDVGEVFIREWKKVFRVTNYSDPNGYKLEIDNDNHVDVQTSQAQIEIAHSSSKGARLVVIDGQHRLYALNQLRQESPEVTENILLPVCIIYSPITSINRADATTPKVYEILRHLFVDVNETVVRVSGHFTILLSDQTVGGLACRAFCTGVLDKYERNGLALVEWNTKSDKESKTISKDYTITSIGVINEALLDYFKLKKWRESLYYTLGMSEQDALELFKVDDEEPINIPENFPWSGFGYSQKPYLDEKIKNILSPILEKLFFETGEYKKIYNIFSEAIDTQIISNIKAENPDIAHYKVVRNSFLEGAPLGGLDKTEAIQKDFLKYCKQKINENVRSIVRTKVFQKALIGGLIEFIDKLKSTNTKVEHIAYVYMQLIDLVFDSKFDIFKNDETRKYLQVTIYDGVRIKPTQNSVNQIRRLILSLLGSKSILRKLTKSLCELDDTLNGGDLENALNDLGVNQAGLFNNERFDVVKKEFIKKYPTNFNLDTKVREELENKEKEFKLAQAKGDDSEELSKSFDDLVLRLIQDDIVVSKAQLDEVLKFRTSSKSLEEAYEEIEV
ncbi:MAG: hypothetical protein CMQ38_12095 [Gammaproteobacteria bacterium]|nr:hypothetical protein [Gammaproteobacteria bacterium]